MSKIQTSNPGAVRNTTDGESYIPMAVNPSNVPTVEGTLSWNSTDHTLNIQSEIPGSILQVGQENWVRAVNKTGSTITDGTAVYISGAQGNRPTITPAKADAETTSYTIGVATDDIADNAEGYVTVLGLVRGYDTSSFTAGDQLYLSSTTAGGLTKTRPVAPNHGVFVAIALNSTNNGTIFVNPNIGFELSELHDVLISAIANGDLLVWDSVSGVWKNAKKIGDGVNFAEFESNGFIKLTGTAKYWRDIDFPIIIRTTGPGIPALTPLNGNITMPSWAVNDYNVCESEEFVHAWEEESTSYWHIHLTTNGLDATDRYVRFTVEFGYVTVDGQWVFPSVMDSGDLLIPANTPTKTMKTLSLGNFTPTGVKIGGHCVAVLKRITSTGAAPTGNPWVGMLQLHIHCDTEGSRNIGTK